MPSDHLTDKQEEFCRAYSLCRNARVAAERAGYSSPASRGCTLLGSPAIRERIQELTEDHRRLGPATKVLRAELEKMLAACLEIGATAYVEWDGAEMELPGGGNFYLKSSAMLSLEERRNVKKIKVRSTKHGPNIEIETRDPQFYTTAIGYLAMGGSEIEEWSRKILAGLGAFDEPPEPPEVTE